MFLRYRIQLDPWFDRPLDRLTVPSKIEGLTTVLRHWKLLKNEIAAKSRKKHKNQIPHFIISIKTKNLMNSTFYEFIAIDFQVFLLLF